MDSDKLQNIPSVNVLLEHPLLRDKEHERVKHAAQLILGEIRNGIISGTVYDIPSSDECAKLVLDAVEEIPNLRGVINATGVILHTNLGRAPLGDAISAAVQVLWGYSNLEYDLQSGQRGSRYSHVEKLICELTGAEAAMVVNNNAAAVFLMLKSIAQGKRVAISRGELVEIGGSFRVPEIMEQSGAVLMEVGTTNKTRIQDFCRAVDNGAEVLLKVHTSNYEVVGFTETVPLTELAAFGKEKKLPVLYDMGSCFLVEPELLGLRVGETARYAIESGADVICFSGDKLTGCAQAGILAGREEYISAIKSHPLARTVRPDKMTLAALEASLRIYRFPNEAVRRIPVLAMLSAKPETLRQSAEALAERLRHVCAGWRVGVRETTDETGGGSLPNTPLPGWAVTVEPVGVSVQEFEKRLRLGRIPVIIRINAGAAMLSPRTLLPGDHEALEEAVRAVYCGI